MVNDGFLLLLDMDRNIFYHEKHFAYYNLESISNLNAITIA